MFHHAQIPCVLIGGFCYSPTAFTCPPSGMAAELVQAKFEKAFELFKSCHVIYDLADLLGEETITEQGKQSAKVYYMYTTLY